MPIPATLSELKDEIRARSREDGMCENLQDALDAPDYETLVQTGIGYIRFVVESGIMDDDMISGIDEAILNDAGIYSTGTPVITNPDKEIYLLKNVVATINIDTPGKYRINAYMQAGVEINATNQAFIRVQGFDDADITLNQEDDILSHVHITHNVNLQASIINNAACNIIADSSSVLSLVTNDDSYTALKLYGNSALEYTQNGASTLIINAYESSTSTDITP